MLSALEFWEVERKQAVAKAEATPRDSAEAYPAVWRMNDFDHWTLPDYMDFAERYADYVCNYEKRDDYQNARTEEKYVREVSA
jgi:hypothetical protein